MVQLKIKNELVKINNGEITATMPEIEELLTQHLTIYPSPGPADPYPDLLQARRIAADFNGQIIKADDPPKAEPGVVY
jgi:hypothetical protein